MNNCDEKYWVYFDSFPHFGPYSEGENAEIIIKKDPTDDIVIESSDIELGEAIQEEEAYTFHITMPNRDVHIKYKFVHKQTTCIKCGKEHNIVDDICPHCGALAHKYAAEIKGPRDCKFDGVLAWGVELGRFVFEEFRTIVYIITDTPHIGPSDTTMFYQITKDDYVRLSKMVPVSFDACSQSVPSSVTSPCRRNFLCGESIHCKRNKFTLRDVDLSLIEKY